MAATMRNGTGRDAVDFWRWVGDRGLANKSTAEARRSGVAEVLEATDSLDLDVRELDLDDALVRFTNVRAAKYTPSSLAAYKSRFRKGIADYIRWLDNPDGWRPDVQTRSSPSKRAATEVAVSGTGGEASVGKGKLSKSKNSPDRAGSSHSHTVGVSHTVTASTSQRLINYPFPVRDGTIAMLSLPSDLTTEEANRLAGFVKALAMPLKSPF